MTLENVDDNFIIYQLTSKFPNMNTKPISFMQENWQTIFQTNIWQVHNFLLNSLRCVQSENFNVILSMNTPKQNHNLAYNIIKPYI